MKQLNQYIKEGLKINSKSKIKDNIDVEIKDIYDFANKYDCKVIFKFLLEASDICTKAFDKILKLSYNKWNEYYYDIERFIYEINKSSDTSYYIGRSISQDIIYVKSTNNKLKKGQIKIFIDIKTKKFFIQEDIRGLSKDQIENMYKILDYMIQYYENTKK